MVSQSTIHIVYIIPVLPGVLSKFSKPRVYYIDPYKMTKYFIAGAVIYEDVDECAEGVTKTLINSSGKSVKIKTKSYGSFDFDVLVL